MSSMLPRAESETAMNGPPPAVLERAPRQGEFGRSVSHRRDYNAMALVLAGGRGTRLHHLTDWRAKPAVPFGGKFRIIDFTLSNCVNSGIRRIGICTQYKAQSLIRHVERAWSFLAGRFDEFVDVLPAQQWIHPRWYGGTADAAYQNLDMMLRHRPDRVLILAGDHVYKMDYRVMLDEHTAHGADMSIACVDVPRAEAQAFGVVHVDDDGWIVGFEEKPVQPASMPGRPDRALASMGVYVLNTEFLSEALARDAGDARSQHDFGHDLIPRLIAQGARVRAHDFAASCVNMSRGMPYWRDIGTVDAYWEANVALTDVVPDLNLYDEDWPIWTHQQQLPPAKFVFNEEGRRGMAVDSLVAGGCIVSGAKVERSVLFTKVQVHDFASIDESVILPGVEVGSGAVVRRAIVDKYCRLPPGLRVGIDPEEDRRRFFVTPRGITLVVPEMLGQRVHHFTERAEPAPATGEPT
jgi:glucose-1-phosphate adenylyltransferase